MLSYRRGAGSRQSSTYGHWCHETARRCFESIFSDQMLQLLSCPSSVTVTDSDWRRSFTLHVTTPRANVLQFFFPFTSLMRASSLAAAFHVRSFSRIYEKWNDTTSCHYAFGTFLLWRYDQIIHSTNVCRVCLTGMDGCRLYSRVPWKFATRLIMLYVIVVLSDFPQSHSKYICILIFSVYYSA